MTDIRCSTCKGAKTLTFEQGQRCVPCVTCSGSGIDWRKSYDAAQAELSTLREELRHALIDHSEALRGEDVLADRLTAAEQRNAEMSSMLIDVLEWFDDGVGRSDAEFAFLSDISNYLASHDKPTDSGASE